MDRCLQLHDDHTKGKAPRYIISRLYLKPDMAEKIFRISRFPVRTESVRFEISLLVLATEPLNSDHCVEEAMVRCRGTGHSKLHLNGTREGRFCVNARRHSMYLLS